MRCFLRSAGRYWALFAGLLFLIESSCAVRMPVLETDLKKADLAGSETYWLKTQDRHVYEFEKFAVTDSTLIILEGKSYGMDDLSRTMSRLKAPVVIPWGDVESLERAERSNVMTAFAIAAGVIVVGGVVFAALWVHAIAEGLSHQN